MENGNKERDQHSAQELAQRQLDCYNAHDLEGFLAALFTLWQQCPVVISSQNPEFPATDVDAARISRHLAIQSAIRGQARARGWGYVPVYEAFAAQADGGKALVQPDGIHPVIGGGTTLQSNTLKAWLSSQSRRP